MKDAQKSKTSSSIHGVGRRKKAVARVWLSKGSGTITVNGLNHEEYFDTLINRSSLSIPFKVANQKGFDAKVSVNGGGMKGQADAIRLGIARALLESDETLRATLRKNDLLTVDSRVKERKKYGQRGARRKFQFVKR
ncbi:30S ribosomal protein S9 [Candidatus Babeliales bacterium]|nr:30S ribosomal protein S9 [Candidatus Babeliales bacterium]